MVGAMRGQVNERDGVGDGSKGGQEFEPPRAYHFFSTVWSRWFLERAAKVPQFECYRAIVDSLSRLLHCLEHCVEIRANSVGNRASVRATLLIS
jgi:hypothetical protein